MIDNVLDYAQKKCTDCNYSTSIYDNICDKCGNWLELQLNEQLFKRDWVSYIGEVNNYKINLGEMLKHLFPPNIYNFTVSNTILIFIDRTLERISNTIKNLNRVPDISSNTNQKQIFQNKIENLLEFLQSERIKLNKSKNYLVLQKINNPLQSLILSYAELWKEWNEINKQNLAIPQHLSSDLNNILEEIKKVENLIFKGYDELNSNLKRIMADGALKSRKSIPSGIVKIIEEYQIIMSILVKIKENKNDLRNHRNNFEKIEILNLTDLINLNM